MNHPGIWPQLPLRVWDLGLIVVLTLGSTLLLDFASAGLPPSTGGIVAVLVLQSILLLGAIWIVAMVLRGATPEQLGLRGAPRRWYFRAVEIAFLTLPLVWLINAAMQAILGAPFENPQLKVIAPGGQFSWSALIGMMIVTGVAAPVAEEIAFRAVLYGWLRQRFGVMAGVVVSALLFSLAHGIPMLIPALAAQGVVLAFIYERSRSIWPSIIAHGTYNAATIVLLYSWLATGVAPG